MLKKTAVAIIMFLAALCASAQGGHVPTTASNNVWTAPNHFNGGIFLPALRSCTSPSVMAGFDASFQPICVTVSSVTSLNSLVNDVVIAGDSNITATLVGQTLQLHCPGCSGGSGGTPGGSSGSLQWNNAGSFGGTVIVGLLKSNGTGFQQALADTDFQLPITINCTGTGITCPRAGDTWNISLTGGAGTGAVASGITGAVGGYASTGTTISSAPNSYVINPAWSKSQINGLISRLEGASITAWSINTGTGNTTFTAVNAYNAGDALQLFNFPSAANFFNNQSVTVIATGLSNTQFEVTNTFSQSTSSGTQFGVASFNVPGQTPTSYGTINITPGYIDNPAQQIINGRSLNGGPEAQIADQRKGYGWGSQASGYGVQCGTYTVSANISSGNNTLDVGSDRFAPLSVGMVAFTSIQTGFGQNMTQSTWITHVASYSFPTITFTDNAPFPVNGYMTFAPDNQLAISHALQANAGTIPVVFPQCDIMSDTVRWNGANLVGQQMNSTRFHSFPGHDGWQQQDSLPVSAWSISTTNPWAFDGLNGTGTTTFTIPWYAAHSAVVGDVISLSRFAVSTFFDGQSATIVSHPTPLTVVVNSVFGQSSNASATEPGLAGPTTSVGTNAIRVENETFVTNNAIDPTYPWTEYIGSASGVLQPPYYRPTEEFNEPMNDPRAPGWGNGTNGVAIITQNTSVICAPSTGPQPTVGKTILFPYQGSGLQAFTVASTAGSCSTGWNPYTLSAYNGGPSSFPNTSAWTSPQDSWWQYTALTGPQSVGIAIPTTISYPYTLYMNTPFPPIPAHEANVSSHGRISIGTAGDQFEYMGDTFGGTGSQNWVVTSVANASGSSTTYSGSFTGLSCSTPKPVLVQGFTHQGNNGVFTCTASTGTTFTVTSSTGVAETLTSTVSSPPPSIILRTGPTSINSGAGDPHNAPIMPLNPCFGMKDNAWPVVNTINTTTITAWSVTSNVATFTSANRFYVGQVIRLTSPGGDDAAFNGLEVIVLSSGLSTTSWKANITMANGSGTTVMAADGGATPVNATYYAGLCVGNAAISLPEADGNNTVFNGSGFSIGYFNNVAGGADYTRQDPNSGSQIQNNNGSAWMWQQANNTGYGDTWDNIRVTSTAFGLAQGPASVNQHGVRAVGPTSTGQSWRNCTFRTGYPFSIDSMQQSNMDRCDTYSTETSPYDGIQVGAATGLFIGQTNSEYDGGVVTNVAQFTIKDYNSEPENGIHQEIPPSVISDCINCTWIGNIFEGGFNIFGGQYQIVDGTSMSVPIFNYGNNNYFENLFNVNVGYYDNNVWDGTNEFYNWGTFSTCQGQVGTGSGPKRTVAVGCVQDYNGHDIWASMMGNGVHPTENLMGGMFLPGEFSNVGFPLVYDSTELWWGQHTECNIGPGLECLAAAFDGFGGFIYIGPHQRITDTQMVLKANVRLKNPGTTTFRILFAAQNAFSNSTCTPNFGFDGATITATDTSWTAISAPVDFTGFASCVIGLQFDNGAANNVLEIGYFNFVPFASQLYMPLGQPSSGTACPVSGEFKMESTKMWLCAPASGATFGPGTWKSAPIS